MDSKESCCCGPFRTDIHTGAFLVALAGAFLSLLSAIISFLPTTEWHENDPILGLASIFSIFLYSAVIYGQRKKKPVFYLPFLIFAAVEIVFYIFTTLVQIARTFSPPNELVKEFYKENPDSTNPEKDYKIHSALECLYLILGIGLSAFFFSIIWKSYKKTREEIGQTGQGFIHCV